MPEFLPTPQLPTGLAEETIRLTAQRGENNPWVALAKAAGTIGQGFAARRAREGPTLTPEQAIAIGLPSSVPGAPLPNGAQGPVQPVNLSTAFPNGISRDLAENVLQRRTQENVAKEMTGRAFGVQDKKTELAQNKDHTLANTELLKNYPAIAKMGFKEGDLVPNRFIGEQSKPSSDQSLTSDEMNALTRATLREKDPLDTQIITFKGPRAKVLAQALLKNPDYTPKQAAAEMAGAKSGAAAESRLEKSGPPQILARYAESTKEVLKVAEEASQNYPRYGAQFLNTAYDKLASQSSPEALQFKQVIGDLRGHIAAVLAKGYAPQKEQIEEAKRYIPDSITPDQLTKDLPFLNRLIDIQVHGMMTPVTKEQARAAGQSAKPKSSTGTSTIGRFQVEVH